MLPLIAFHDLVFNRVPEEFPQLRWAWIEAASTWVPFLLYFLGRAGGQRGFSPEFMGPQLFEDYRFYIAFEDGEGCPASRGVDGLGPLDHGH